MTFHKSTVTKLRTTYCFCKCNLVDLSTNVLGHKLSNCDVIKGGVEAEGSSGFIVYTMDCQ